MQANKGFAAGEFRDFEVGDRLWSVRCALWLCFFLQRLFSPGRSLCQLDQGVFTSWIKESLSVESKALAKAFKV